MCTVAAAAPRIKSQSQRQVTMEEGLGQKVFLLSSGRKLSRSTARKMMDFRICYPLNMVPWLIEYFNLKAFEKIAEAGGAL